MSKSIAILAAIILLSMPSKGQEPTVSTPKMHILKPTPKTVVWGYFDGASKPVLKVKSGATVEVQTLR